jgi:hypothetical protein
MTNRKSPTTEQIEQRAYALFLQRGGQDGHALEDWLIAESELTEVPELTESSAPETPKTRAATASAGQRSSATASGSARESSSK